MNKVLGKVFNAEHILKNTERQGELPSDEALLKNAVKVAWPSTLESFLMALVGLIDTIMVSSLGSAAIAAVGLSTQPKFICLAPFLALSIAVSAIVARRRGQEDRAGANRVLLQALLLTLLIIAVLSTLAVVFAEPVLRFVGTNEDTHEMATAYFRIIAGGLVFNALTLVINAGQRGCGNTRIAMRTNMASNLVNIVFNYLLIGGHFGFPALGVAGAAIATVLGSVVGFVMALRSVLNRDSFVCLLLPGNSARFDKETMKSIANVGGASLAEQLFLRFGFLMYTKVVAHLGTDAFAAHQVGMNILTLSFAFGDGLSVASVALVGRSLGQKRTDIAKVYGGFCQRIGVCIAAVLAVIYIFLGRDIFSLFSSDPVVLNYGVIIMRFMSVIIFMQISHVVYNGCLRGAGDTRYVAMVSLISVAFIRPFSGWLFVYPLNWGLTGAWLGLALDQLCRYSLSMVRFKSDHWLGIDV